MALNTVLTQSLQHRMALTPAMREAMSLLSFSTPELIHHIEQEAQNNPLLVVDYPQHRNTSGISEYDIALDTVAASGTLGENLRQQLTIMPLDKPIKNIALYLTGDLTDDGFLSRSADEIADDLDLPIEIIEQSIQALQTCEPTGIAARDLKECLLLQLIETGIDEATGKMILENAALFAKRAWGKLSKIFHLPEAQLKTFGEALKSLNPTPAKEFSEQTEALVADILVKNDPDKGLIVSLFNPNFPTLSVDDDLLNALKNDGKTLDYLITQKTRAKTLIQVVEFRSKTILKVARSIVSFQHRFFSEDQKHLIPLTRIKIAKQLEMHASTIGRAIAHKNISINGAIYPMRYFFSTSIGKAGKTQISAHNIKQSIRKMVLAETHLSIHSDENIVEKLHAQGVDIARRTVAKYRGCMNIPSSAKRRRILAAKAAPSNGLGGVRNTRK